MDGSNFSPRHSDSDQDTTTDRAAMRRAFCVMTITLVLTIGAVLAFAHLLPTTYAQMGAWFPAGM